MRFLPLLLLGCPTVEFTDRTHADLCPVVDLDADTPLPSGATVREVLQDLEGALVFAGPPGEPAALELELDRVQAHRVAPETGATCKSTWESYVTGVLRVDGIAAPVELRLELDQTTHEVLKLVLLGEESAPGFLAALTGSENIAGPAAFYVCLGGGIDPVRFPYQAELSIWLARGELVYDVEVDLRP